MDSSILPLAPSCNKLRELHITLSVGGDAARLAHKLIVECHSHTPS